MCALNFLTAWYQSPSRCITPGRNCSTISSVFCKSGTKALRSLSLFKSRSMLFLPRLSIAKTMASPSWTGGITRMSSPPGRSILITSAPASASIRVASGPGSRVVKSRTRTPESGCMSHNRRMKDVLARIVNGASRAIFCLLQSPPEDRVRKPQREHRHRRDDGEHEQQDCQERQNAADHGGHRRDRDRGQHKEVEADRRVDQP